MKKIINIFLVCIAILTLAGITAVVQAQQGNEIATNTAKKSVDYFLPYPGILPGNPLYPLKMIRDKIVSLFITDPFKKAEFYLLMADKRINAGKFLSDYGKNSLSEPTINKGQNYLDKGVEIISKEKKQDLKSLSLLKRIKKANLKYEEILSDIEKKVPEGNKPGIRNSIERSKKTGSLIENLLKSNKDK